MKAEVIAKGLGGRKGGAGWMAPCPAHDDHDPSLSITANKCGGVLVYCHAGCQQRDVIAALRARGLWESKGRGGAVQPKFRATPQRKPEVDPDDTKRSEAALGIWRASKAAASTQVDTYLRSRGLHLLPGEALRFSARLKHPAGGVWPGMVALVTRGVDGVPIAIHRTFLAPDGCGKAPIDPPRMMLGPCRGGVVRLGNPGDTLMIGEGIETCLAAMQVRGHPAWAALSASGLRTLDLPGNVREVIVLADGDDAGEAAAHDSAHRWKREGRRVRIARPPRGMDFNDLLLNGIPSNAEAGE